MDREKNIIFYEKEHKYCINGETDYTSVTTFIKTLFEEFDVEKVISFILKSKKINDPNYEYYNMNANQIKQVWKQQTLLGTLLHKDIENYYGDIEVNNTSKEYQFFKNFVFHNKHLKPFKSEWRIYSEKLKICGTIDMIYQLENGNYVLCDFKRSRGINLYDNYGKFCLHPKLSHIPDTNYYHYSIQLSLYKYILETCYDMKIESMFLLVLHPNNENYITYEVNDILGNLF